MSCSQRNIVSGYCANTGNDEKCATCYYNGVDMRWTYKSTAKGKIRAEVEYAFGHDYYRAAAIRETQSEAIKAASVKLNRLIKRYGV